MFSLLTLIGGVVAQGVIANGLLSSRDAALTATNILAHRELYLLSFTIFLVEMAANTATVTLFYVLLRPVDRTAALLSLVFGLVGCTIKTLARAFYYAPPIVFDGSCARPTRRIVRDCFWSLAGYVPRNERSNHVMDVTRGR